MQIKVDEDLPRAAVQMLRYRGRQAMSVLEQGMGGYKDPALWQAVQTEHRYLVTADKGFAGNRQTRVSQGHTL
jgi:predicted nuclease of predicted toxin-antitoxin system